MFANMIERCVCCGETEFILAPVLWPALIKEWQLAAYEIAYINRQQGLHCRNCRSNLRSMALAQAIMQCYGYAGRFQSFVETDTAQRLRVLEINEAGNLTPFLSRIPAHVLTNYPHADILSLPFLDQTFDLIVHSDTLEHVPEPIQALSECRRVLRPGGVCAFTVPIVVDRLTRSRAGLPASFHGDEGQSGADWRVHTEYGSDAWKQVVLAGYDECRIVALEYPAAAALLAVRAPSMEEPRFAPPTASLPTFQWAAALAAGKRVLSVGHGNLHAAPLLAATAQEVAVVDAAIALAGWTAKTVPQNLIVLGANLADVPAELDAAFDLIIALDHFVRMPEAARAVFMTHARRLLQETGVLVIGGRRAARPLSEPHHAQLYGPAHLQPEDLRRMVLPWFEFTHVLGQRTESVTRIWPLDNTAAPTNGALPSGIEVPAPDPTYLIALCAHHDLEHNGLASLVRHAMDDSAATGVLSDALLAKDLFIQALKQSFEHDNDQRARQLDALVVSLNQQIETQAADLDRQLAKQVADFNSQLEARIGVVREQSAQLQQMLADFKSELVLRDEIIRGLEGQTGALRQELATIQGSRAWSFMKGYWTIGENLRSAARGLRRRMRPAQQPQPALLPVAPSDAVVARSSPLQTPVVAPTVDADAASTLSKVERELFDDLLTRLEIISSAEDVLARLGERATRAEIANLRDVLRLLDEARTEVVRTPAVVRAGALPALRRLRQRNILFVAGEFPNPTHGGGGRLADIIRSLGETNNVYLYTWYREEDQTAYRALEPYCQRIVGVPLDEFERPNLPALHGLVTGIPIDVVHYEWSRSLKYVDRSLGELHIYTSIEAVSLRKLIDMQHEVPLSDAWVCSLIEVINALKVELIYTAKLDAVLVLTEKDGEFLARFHPSRQYYVVETGVALSAYQIPERQPDPKTVAFIGNFRHYPNEDAMRFFFETIYDRVLSAIPDVTIYIVGAHPTEIVQRYHDGEHVIVTGMVEDVRPYIQQAQVCIAPLISGAGIRTKVNQYAALKRVTVATPIATVDLSYEDGHDIFIESSPEVFAERLIMLLRDPRLAQSMGEAAYERVVSMYSIEAAIASQQRLYDYLLEQQATGSGAKPGRKQG